MVDDPRKGHPDFTPTDPPTAGKRTLGVRVPPLPKVPVERGEPPQAPTQQDPWVARIGAITALVVTVSAAGWGGAKMTERDVPSASQAAELTEAMRRTEAALTSCRADVAKLQKLIETAEKKAEEQTKTIKRQEKQILAHAHTIWLLNGQVSPIYGWPEPRLNDWTIGVDNLHRHNRRGGEYPGSDE